MRRLLELRGLRGQLSVFAPIGLSRPRDKPYPESDLDSAFTFSATFVEFLAYWLSPEEYYRAQWFDQTTEQPGDNWRRMRASADVILQRILLHERAVEVVTRAYDWFKMLVMGDARALKRLHERVKFISVIGIPRTGGSYLTAELFSSLGYNKRTIHPAVAHDGFPDATPFHLAMGRNSWLTTLASMAQYLTAVELFFDIEARSAVVVPKKATKAVYEPGLFRAVMGTTAEYIVTLRHPIASCISTYEMCGGLPPGGRFRARSTIERWIKRDHLWMGLEPQELDDIDYFDAYIRWWEQFHLKIALSGFLTTQHCTVVTYDSRRMEDLAEQFRVRFGGKHQVEHFVCNEALVQRHPEWIRRSEEAMERVAAAWRSCGAVFPIAQLTQC